MNSMQQIAERLLAQNREKAEDILAEARREAGEIRAKAEKKAQAEGEALRLTYQDKEQEFARRDALNEKMQKRRLLLHAKQELVDGAVERVRERFLTQTQEQWIALLQMVLRRSLEKDPDSVPTVIVPEAMVRAAREAVPARYPVEAGGMRHGFVLSFEAYDLNYEAGRLFAYQKENWEQEAARYLFEGDADA